MIMEFSKSMEEIAFSNEKLHKDMYMTHQQDYKISLEKKIIVVFIKTLVVLKLFSSVICKQHMND